MLRCVAVWCSVLQFLTISCSRLNLDLLIEQVALKHKILVEVMRGLLHPNPKSRLGAVRLKVLLPSVQEDENRKLVCIYTYMCVCVCMCAFVYVCVCLGMRVCVHVCLYGRGRGRGCWHRRGHIYVLA